MTPQEASLENAEACAARIREYQARGFNRTVCCGFDCTPYGNSFGESVGCSSCTPIRMDARFPYDYIHEAECPHRFGSLK